MKFYIGDLCYVLSYEDWDDVCAAADDGYVELDNGKQVQFFGTKGDGVFRDNKGNTYGVDSGTIGIIAVKDIEKIDGIKDGRVHDLPYDSVEEMQDFNEGNNDFIAFNNKIIIQLNEDEDEEDEDEDEDEDER